MENGPNLFGPMDSAKNRLYEDSAAHFAPVAEVPIPEHIEANRSVFAFTHRAEFIITPALYVWGC
ncbi:MAG: hypothetical protein JWL90_1104 [Chthoniobacteraceae bacterium]|nr:hypothetical protein [Chthoniobacteraceae bacterium]